MGVRLLESGVRQRRSFAGAVPSIALHAGLLGLGIYATTSAGAHPAPPPTTGVVRIRLPGPPEPKPAPSKPSAPDAPAKHSTSTPTPSREIRVPGKLVIDVDVRVPTNISTGIPDVSTPLMSHGGDFSAESGVLGGSGRGRGGGGGGGASGTGSSGSGSSGYFTGTEVDERAYPLPGAPRPPYPEVLRAAGITGNVLAQFVIDSAGRFVQSSFHVVSSDNPLFTDAVRRTLARTRYRAARIAGAPVRQLVQQQFTFTITSHD